MSQNVSELPYMPVARARARVGNPGLLAVFVATLLLSSFLLFLVQPMFGKMVLPLLGGTPSVWNTAMLFFQATLLAGYAYSHLIVSRLSLGRQMLVHLSVLAVPLLVVPIALPQGLRPPTDGTPIGWLLLLMTTTVGLPFFAVSTTAPLLQRWFSRTDHPSGSDPYFLYAASNAGSLAALVAYPLAVEPLFVLERQSWLWAAGYAALVAAVALCAVVAWGRRSSGSEGAEQTIPATKKIAMSRRLRWIALALVPSSLMIGVTTHLSTDIAAIPLLWVIPLTLYLVTFIVTFSKVGPRVHRSFRRAAPLMALLLIFSVATNMQRPIGALLLLHLATFFAIAMALHGELNRDRPAPERLTEFYLWISVGGALGGVVNALIAPAVLDSLAEYPLMIVAGCLLMMGALELSPGLGRRLRLALTLGVPVGMLALTLWVTVIMAGKGDALVSERNFFGIHRVTQDETHLKLVHGTTVHGSQSLDPDHALEPLTYYHRTGPVGQIFETFGADPSRSNVGVVGLGAGSLACYGTPAQQWTFYEIDPAIERVARDTFSFLDGCGGTERVVIGDARLTLADTPAGGHDLLVIDAFTSDAIPVHLVTEEALDLYENKLSPDGLLAFHVSNRYLDMIPVLAALADGEGLTAMQRIDREVTRAQSLLGKTPSQWVLMSRERSQLQPLFDDPRWSEIRSSPSVRGWTDSYSNILSVFKWN